MGISHGGAGGLRSSGLRPSLRGLAPEFHLQIEKTNIIDRHLFTMESVDLQNFKTINTIIERDSKDATYKFALIRGAIEVFQYSDHFKKEKPGGVTFPLGLLIERWFLYYYPIFESEIFIPQMGADTRFNKERSSKPKFRAAFDPIIEYYRENGGGFSECYSDYQNGRIPSEIRDDFLALCVQIRDTIVDMPMKHLGYSIRQNHNEIFEARKGRPGRNVKAPVDPAFLVQNYGEFTIKNEYYDALKNVGPFLIGDNSLLFRWAQFSERRVENDRIKFGEILKTIADYPVEERDIQDSKRFYAYLMGKGVLLRSVWSNRKISAPIDEQALDHLIPFSAWKNNDLWNILPALKTENSQKSDKIPDPALLVSQKEIILEYWKYMMEFDPGTFTRQIRYSLIGNDFDPACWQEQAFVSLERKCRHMTEVLGYAAWTKPQ